MNRFALTLCLVVVSSLYGLAEDAETYFRKDQGRAGDTRALPETFDAKRQLVWKQEVSPGISTPCLHGDLVILTTWEKARKELATVVLDRQSGKLRWKQAAPITSLELTHPTGSPAACSPACDGERIYVFFGSSGLICYDLDGRQLWYRRLGPFQDQFGASSSPILVGDLLVLSEDHDVKSFLIAFNKKTGKTVWRTSREGQTRSYSTPVVWKHQGQQVLVVAGALKMTAYEVGTGKPLWWVNGLSRIVDTTPVIANGLLYVATWTPGGDTSERISMEPFADARKKLDKNNNGKIARTELAKGTPVEQRFFRIDLDQDGELNESEWKKHAQVFAQAQNVAMAVRPGGKGDVTKSHVKWIARKGLPVVPSPAVYQGVMYMVKNGGILTSLDATTGKQTRVARIPGRGNYYASLVAGDGKVYACSEKGVVSIIKAGKDWSVIGKHDFGERVLATPVIRDGQIFVRTDSAIYCYGRN